MHRLSKCLFFVFALSSIDTATAQDRRCLTSTQTKKPIRLEMTVFSDDDWQGGYVRYAKGKPIPIVLLSSVATDKPPGRPWEFESRWLEIANGKANGTYVVTSQGAVINGFRYEAPGGKKPVEFTEDPGAHDSAHDHCVW